MDADGTPATGLDATVAANQGLAGALLDALPAHVALLDGEGRILAVNQAWRSFGAANGLQAPPEVHGTSYLGICDRAHGLGAESAAAVAAGIRAVLAGRQSHLSLEYPCHSPDQPRWFRLMVTPLCLGATRGAIVMHIDVTERLLAEEELRASEEHYRLLFAQNPHPMWVIDCATLRYLAVNDAAVRYYGYSKEEFLRMTILDLRAPSDAQSIEEALRTMPTGFSRSIRHHRKKDGTELIVDATSDAVRFGDRPARLITAQDVTERERDANRIAEQAALLDHAQDAIIVRDMRHRITYWNKSAERLYGWTAGEVLHQPVHEYGQIDPVEFERAMRHLVAAGEWSGEFRQVDRQGKHLMVQSRWSLLRDPQGAPKAVLVINTDITARKELERQYYRAQRMESIGTLAGGIAHDLNNLLAPIIMGVGLLREQNPGGIAGPILQTIETSALRGAALVKQVLAFARGQDGERIPLPLPRLVSEVEAIVRNTFPRNIRCVTEVEEALPRVLGDHTQIHQVLINLCVNARDAMPDGGTLTLRVRSAHLDQTYAAMTPGVHPGDHVVLEVQDDGVGISPELREHIFDPFYTTKDVGHGTGLGLSTALGIVRGHEGFIKVYSEPGRGTTFTVYLPVREKTPEHEPPPAPAATTLPRGRGELILLVDDEAAVREVARHTLEAFGYRVISAEDGAQAIGLYAGHREQVALVITDMMMPVMDGAALIRALLRLNPALPIIGASGLSVKAQLDPASQLAVREFLPKPYTAEFLLSLVRRVLDGTGSRAPFPPPR
jgi:PAS domain S-box-containing protein